MTARELLARMPELIDADKVADTEAVIQYDISEPTYQVLKGGALTVHQGQAENPDLTIQISDDNLVKLFRGELNPMTAFMTGKLKVKGNVVLAQKLVGMVDREKIDTA